MIAALLTAAALALSPQAGDVQLAAQHLRDDHPNLFRSLSPTAFDASVADLTARADTLNDDELLVGLMRLAALPGPRNGHTGIFPMDPGDRRPQHAYPTQLYTFSDGTYVVGQIGGRNLLRARLVAINGHPLGDVLAAVRPLVPHDNDSTLALLAPGYLNTPEVLHGLQLVPDLGPTRFTFERAGRTFDAVLTPVTASRFARGLDDIAHPLIPQAITGRVPAYIARRKTALWATTLAAGRIYYLGYNAVTGDTFAASERLLRAAQSRKLRGVIVDLRLNGGGNNLTYRPLVNAIQRVGKTRRVVVLISRVTFSAAENFITELELRTKPVFVGEPSGGSPNLYGDSRPTLLPATGLVLHVASIYWQLSSPGDDRLATEPRVRVPLSSASFFAGRDPVLAAARSVVLGR
ncbi:MAG TPA: hypothetical protein VIR59_09510 [Gaiellaceae bacterium]